MKRAKSGQILLLTVIIVFFLSQCGGASQKFSSSTSSTSSSGQTTAPVVGGNISSVSLDSGANSVTFSDLADEDEVVVMLYSFEESGSSNSFQLGASQNELYSIKNLITPKQPKDFNADVTGEFHEFLRNSELDLDPDALLEDGDVKTKNLTKYLSEGYQKTFKVLNSFSSTTNYETVTATLRLQTSDFQFYVDNRNSSSLTDQDLKEIADQYASVLPIEKELFGDESDTNGDGKFAILFTQAVNELGASSGGMVTGFFYAVDLFDSTQYEISNEMEVVYTFVPDALGTYGSAVSKSFAMSNIYPGVIAHEFQHLVSFNMHYNVNGASSEKGWLNEGLSHLAEDIYSSDTQAYMTESGLENPARVSSYLSNIDSICFTCGTSLSQRGGSYLFVRYLYEQAQLGNLAGSTNGSDFLGKLLDTTLTGVSNVVYASFGASASQADFKSLLGLFGLAVYLSNTGNTSDNRLGFSGINLRSSQDDNRGTVLNGPAIQSISSFPYFDALSGSSVTYIQMTGKTISDNGGQIDFQVGSSGVFGGYLIQ